MKYVFAFLSVFALSAHAELKIDTDADCKGYGPTSTNLVVTSDAMEGGIVGLGYENLAGLNEFAVRGEEKREARLRSEVRVQETRFETAQVRAFSRISATSDKIYYVIRARLSA